MKKRVWVADFACIIANQNPKLCTGIALNLKQNLRHPDIHHDAGDKFIFPMAFPSYWALRLTGSPTTRLDGNPEA